MADKPINYDPSCMDDYDPNSMEANLAQQHIIESVQAITETETVPIREALHRVLAQSLISSIDVPSHTNSAMDGYAFNGDQLPTEESGVFKQVGIAYAGRPYVGNVAANECVRIMTGAAMPGSTDTVVMQEHVEVNDNNIRIDSKQKSGQNVRLAGEDIKLGAEIFGPNYYLQAADIGLIASLGIAEVTVMRKLKVAFFSTGDELVSIGSELEIGQIYDSNRYTLWSMLASMGVEIIDLGVIRDTPEAIEQAFISASQQADAVITSGGVSVGDADFVKSTLEKLGHVNFWKVAMKPGRPLAFGQINNAFFFGLPGNPVSVMVTFYIFVQAALEKMTGRAARQRLRIQAISQSHLRKRPGRVEYQRGIYQINELGEYTVVKTGAQGSGILHSMSEAKCFIYLPMESKGAETGDMVEIWPFDSFY
jgi:molybdopterin molybdotransferase